MPLLHELDKWRSAIDDEDERYRRVSAIADTVEDMDRCIFNLHVPPYDSSLDTAPALNDKLEVVPQLATAYRW